MTECSLCREPAIIFLKLSPTFERALRNSSFWGTQKLIDALERPGEETKQAEGEFVAFCERHKSNKRFDATGVGASKALTTISEDEYMVGIIMNC